MDRWEENIYEPVTIWSYIGLIFMALTVVAMAACVLWMRTW